VQPLGARGLRGVLVRLAVLARAAPCRRSLEQSRPGPDCSKPLCAAQNRTEPL
jgi:hypothetical protein